MSGFLDAMAGSSRERVAKAVAREPLARLRVRALDGPPAPPLVPGESFGLIAEYKRRSPSQGELAGNGSFAEQVATYGGAGAAAVSVLTEPSEFHGRLADAGEAARTLAPLGIPVLRKDFLVDPYQLYETRAVGAGGALLIVRMLSDAQLREMLDCAAELELFVLLETFDGRDIERAASGIRRGCPLAPRNPQAPLGDTHHHLARGAPVLIGVNCRDLQLLDIAPKRFRELAPFLPEELSRVAESGITTPDDCADVARNGYAFGLVGSGLMSAPDPAALIRTMLAAGKLAA